jgi:hypothetical protein
MDFELFLLQSQFYPSRHVTERAELLAKVKEQHYDLTDLPDDMAAELVMEEPTFTSFFSPDPLVSRRCVVRALFFGMTTYLRFYSNSAMPTR